MNWVGGIRRRLLAKEEERRRQEQFFASHAAAAAARKRGLNRTGRGGIATERQVTSSSIIRSTSVSSVSNAGGKYRRKDDIVYQRVRLGSLSASKIRTGSLSSSKIHAETSSASSILTGSFSSKMRAEASSASRIETGSVSASRIQTGSSSESRTHNVSSSEYKSQKKNGPKSRKLSTPELFKKFKIKPSSLHGPFSIFLLKQELNAIQKKLVRENKVRKCRPMRSSRSERLAKRERQSSAQNREENPSTDRIQECQSSLNNKEQKEKSIENENDHSYSDQTMSQKLKQCTRDIGKRKRAAEEWLSEDTRSCTNTTKEKSQKRVKSIFDISYMVEEESTGNVQNQCRERRREDANNVSSVGLYAKSQFSRSSQNRNSSVKTSSRHSNEKFTQSNSGHKSASGLKPTGKIMSSKLLAGAPRVRKILSLSPERHRGRIWEPLDLTVDDVISKSSEKLTNVDKNDSVKTITAANHPPQPQCPNTPAVIDEERRNLETFRLKLLLGSCVKENGKDLETKDSQPQQKDSNLNVPKLNENKSPLESSFPVCDDLELKEWFKIYEAMNDFHNSEDPIGNLDRRHHTAELGIRKLLVTSEINDGALSCTSAELQKPPLVKKRLNTNRNVVYVESSLNTLRKRQDLTPYMERDSRTYQHFGTSNVSGGSSNRSSRTPSDSCLEWLFKGDQEM